MIITTTLSDEAEMVLSSKKKIYVLGDFPTMTTYNSCNRNISTILYYSQTTYISIHFEVI